MSVKYLEIALFPWSGSRDEELVKMYPVLEKKIEISNDLWITPITKDCADKILDASEPKALSDLYVSSDDVLDASRPNVGSRLFTIEYAFAREIPHKPYVFIWDEDKTLTKLIALSRIIHPTTISYQYTATLKYNANELKCIIPHKTYGLGYRAFIEPNGRDWLTEKDVEELRKLWSVYTNRKFCEPCSKAMWYFEYASRCEFFDQRCLFIAAGIESLINTDKDRSTRQFTYRIQKLGEQLGFNLSNSRASDMYSMRSKVAHGDSIVGPPNMNLEVYMQMEDILRLTIKKFILEEEFYNFISNKDEIRSRWPLPKS